MEHRVLDMRAEVFLLGVVLCAGAALTSCRLSSRSKGGVALTGVAANVAFVRPVSSGYAVAGADGAVWQTVPVRERSWVSSLTPDLSGYSWVEVTSDDESASRMRLMIKLRGEEPVEVLRKTWSGSADPKEIDLTWLSADGRRFAICSDGRLSIRERCTGEFAEKLLTDDVRAFVISGRKVFWTRTMAPATLLSRDWVGDQPLATTELTEAADELLMGEDDDHLLGVSRATVDVAARTRVTWVDVASRSAKSLWIPAAGRVIQIVAVRGSKSAVIELWSGRERLDGTELGQFMLWDYGTGELTALFSNRDGYSLHALAENLHESPSSCLSLRPLHVR
jgi:hypothetical protein